MSAVKVIRNSHGETVYQCVDRIAHGRSRTQLLKIADHCERIAARFLNDADRQMSNFYESVAGDLRSAAVIVDIPKVTPRAMDDLLHIAAELEREGRGSMANSLYVVAMHADPLLAEERRNIQPETPPNWRNYELPHLA